jgi:hypothetical protein
VRVHNLGPRVSSEAHEVAEAADCVQLVHGFRHIDHPHAVTAQKVDIGASSGCKDDLVTRVGLSTGEVHGEMDMAVAVLRMLEDVQRPTPAACCIVTELAATRTLAVLSVGVGGAVRVVLGTL